MQCWAANSCLNYITFIKVIAENKNINEEKSSWQDGVDHHEKRKQLLDECDWISATNDQSKIDSNTHSPSYTNVAYIPNIPKLWNK